MSGLPQRPRRESQQIQQQIAQQRRLREDGLAQNGRTEDVQRSTQRSASGSRWQVGGIASGRRNHHIEHFKVSIPLDHIKWNYLNDLMFVFSWGSGANPWGPEKEDQFSKPNHWDGMLEVVGVTGVVHLGQIQSGLRSAMRIAQVP